jgi:hypothetical protein
LTFHPITVALGAARHQVRARARLARRRLTAGTADLTALASGGCLVAAGATVSDTIGLLAAAGVLAAVSVATASAEPAA